MAGFVSSFVSSADNLIHSVAQSGFGAVLQAVNGIAASCAVLAVCFLVLNQFLQVQYISLSKFLGLFIKLILISVIGLKWSNFSAVAISIQSGMDTIGAKLLTMSAPTSSTTVAGAIDSVIDVLAEQANEAGSKASWFAGAMMSMLVTGLLSLLGCAGALIIIYSKVMFAVFVCIAPIFIACYIFEATKDYFYRWVQGALTYTLYPVLTAAVIGMSYTVIMTYIDSVRNTPIESISAFIPFLAVAMMMVALIMFIPIIVSGLSGMIQNVSMYAMLAPPAKFAGQKAMNMMNKMRSDRPTPPPPAPASSAAQSPAPANFQGNAATMHARAQRIQGK